MRSRENQFRGTHLCLPRSLAFSIPPQPPIARRICSAWSAAVSHDRQVGSHSQQLINRQSVQILGETLGLGAPFCSRRASCHQALDHVGQGHQLQSCGVHLGRVDLVTVLRPRYTFLVSITP